MHVSADLLAVVTNSTHSSSTNYLRNDGGVGLFTIQCLVLRRVLLTCSFQTPGVLPD